ncbi:MAG: type I phosphomannose isomerase catalytic subunit [Planctomycetota bacterium]|nr:type I phosphomannose isomerase catalytic subunit [Planctomycetota bacterium]
MKPYPIIFKPILKEKVWGGRALEKFGKQLPNNTPIGESWELADLPSSIENGKSIIANGDLAGKTLNEAFQDDDHFPLLIKFLDAKDNLSVQVHPSKMYAKKHPNAYIKSEAWIILDAIPGSCIYSGLRPDTTEASLRAAIKDNSVPELLNAIEVSKGECYYLPSGTCHALGAGVLVAEVQTPSDTTFRLWDWGRSHREMHVNQAMQCIDFSEEYSLPKQPKPISSGAFHTTHFVKTPHFSIERVCATNETALPLIVDDAPVAIMVVEGNTKIEHAIPVDAPTGTTILLPSGITNATMQMEKGAAILRFDLPHQKIIA